MKYWPWQVKRYAMRWKFFYSSPFSERSSIFKHMISCSKPQFRAASLLNVRVTLHWQPVFMAIWPDTMKFYFHQMFPCKKKWTGKKGNISVGYCARKILVSLKIHEFVCFSFTFKFPPPFLSILNFYGIGLSLVTFFNFYKGPVVLKHDRKILLLKHL